MGSYEVYNVATGDYITVREIADLAVESLGLDHGKIRYGFTGDVPAVRFDIGRVLKLVWNPKMGSREASQSSPVRRNRPTLHRALPTVELPYFARL